MILDTLPSPQQIAITLVKGEDLEQFMWAIFYWKNFIYIMTFMKTNNNRNI